MASALVCSVAMAALTAPPPGDRDAPSDPGTCDPGRATCVKPCGSIDTAFGKCKPGDNGGGAGGGGGGATCTPGPGGHPQCGGAGPATQAATGAGVSVGGGNPINLLTGNKYQEEVDLPPLPGVLGLELKRHYNSLVPHAGMVGPRWRISYETVLYDVGGQIQIVQADGRRVMFRRDGTGTLCSGPSWEDGQVRIEQPPGAGGPMYHWRWPDGRTLTFGGGSGGGHPLQAIEAPTGQRLTLHYAADGTLLRVRDPQGRELVFIHERGHVQAIDTPLGRVHYRHDTQGRLREATRGDITRTYHYEDAHNGGHAQALTGISVRGPDPATGQPVEQRIATYGYNRSGQATLSVRGRPRERLPDGQVAPDTGIEQLEVAFVSRPRVAADRIDRRTGEVAPRHLGRTVVTDSLGRRTTVLHALIAGHHRLVEMRGAGCVGCGPAAMRYGWDAHGQLRRATRLDPEGHPLSSTLIEYDPHGRLARTGTQAHAPSADTRVRWTARYAYPDRPFPDGSIALAPLPGLIELPSVVPGRVHEWRIDYDARMRPRAWTERGYTPVDVRGELVDGGQPIERTTTLRYAEIAGAHVLAEIDGPLPNGPTDSPADSDITRFEWDAQGRFIAGITLPMGLRVTLAHDDASGRLTAIAGPGPATLRWHYAGDGSVDRMEHVVGEQVRHALSLHHDALGRLVGVHRDAGAASLPLLRQSFDIAGRLRWQVDRLGIVRQARYDTEGHLLASRVRSATMAQEERYRRDANGRLEQVEDDSGAVHRLVRDASGRLEEIVDPLGRRTRVERDPGSRLVEVTQAAGTAVALSLRADAARHELVATARQTPRRLAFRRWLDDFGREVRVDNPDSGRLLRRHDAAGRVAHVQDAGGTTVDLAYDAAGRVVARTVTPNAASGGIPRAAAVPQTTRYRYEGEHLVGVEHPQQDETLAYDDAGRLVSVRVRLASFGGGLIEHELRYRYDALGHLAASSLADGSELEYDRNGQGQVIALHRRGAGGAPFGWGQQHLAAGLQRDVVGLRELRYGNGVLGRWQRSREGVLARIVVTPASAAPPAWRTALEALVGTARAAESPAPRTVADPPNAYALAPEPRALWDGRWLFDEAGNVIAHHQAAATMPRHHTTYAYDAHDQLAQAMRVPTGVLSTAAAADGPAATISRYHHDALGNRLLAQEMQPADVDAHTMRVAYADPRSNRVAATDEIGQPLVDGDRRAEWDADGRLAALRGPGARVARYRYDHRGLRVAKQVDGVVEHHLYDRERHRIADLDAKGRIKRQYVWLADQLIAVVDLDEPRMPHAPPRTLSERIGRAIAATWRLLAGPGERIAYVHVDHLGAPVLMTDRDARPVWSAEYAPFGRRLASPSRLDGVKLPLRLPGQWEDEESGLHYNDHRYYDPSRGRYLSPDPLGLPGGLNGYAYAGNNPVRFSDPSGLLLFAFDGTGNDETDIHRLSNVVKFRDLYGDRAYYITGPGTPDPRSGIDNPWQKGGESADIASSLTGKERIARLIADLNAESEGTADGTAIEIDVVGFSRGAAQARDFANQIARATRAGYYQYATQDGRSHCQRVDFRFLGLWDTVLSAHTGSYALDIPADFHAVAHAVALNEYRTLFPLESIVGGARAPAGTTRIERGFLGSHSDIGGSFPDGELSAVTLSWMVNQAKAAGVTMLDGPQLHDIVASPVLHDKSSNLFKQDGPAPTVFSEDRVIRYRDGTGDRERRASIGGMSFPDTAQFISYRPDPRRYVSGTVDMKRYLAWLDAHGYGIDMTVQ
jgi:RHS repeat-associated protein